MCLGLCVHLAILDGTNISDCRSVLLLQVLYLVAIHAAGRVTDGQAYTQTDRQTWTSVRIVTSISNARWLKSHMHCIVIIAMMGGLQVLECLHSPIALKWSYRLSVSTLCQVYYQHELVVTHPLLWLMYLSTDLIRLRLHTRPLWGKHRILILFVTIQAV